MAGDKKFTLGELAQRLELELAGDPEVLIDGLAALDKAAPGQLTFYHNSRYADGLRRTRASAVILHPEQRDKCPTHALLATKPYIAFAAASRLFAPFADVVPGIHPTAVVDPAARIDPSAEIGPLCVIAADAEIGPRCRLGPHCSVGQGSVLGADSLLHAQVCIYPGVRIGARAIIHGAVVIGADGFGFAFDGERQQKIAQLGGVRIGDDVEIGAGTCIDRGALDDTEIGHGVKIDNQVQIAHNVRVGDHTVICGCSAIAGSSRIGKNCIIAGGVGIINHLTIADGVTVTAMSLVNRSIDDAGVYSSGTPLSDTRSWRRNMLRFDQLEDMAKRLRRLEKALDKNNK